MKIVVLGLMLFSLIMPCSVLSGPEPECPGPNKRDHQDGNYKFTYESWVKKSSSAQDFIFGRCVQNYTVGNNMWVNWEKTGVEGYARPYKERGHYVSNEISSETEKSQLVNSLLWYGNRPDKIDAAYKEIDRKQGGKVSLLSRVSMSLPLTPKDEKSLVPVFFEFISTVFQSGQGYYYTYQVRNAENTPIGLSWRSKTIEDALRKADKKERFTATSDWLKVVINHSNPPEYRIVSVEFFDRQLESRVGRAQTAVYLPVGTN